MGTSRVVKFAPTGTDQLLLQVAETVMQEQSLGFSDLCKQALKQFLLLREVEGGRLPLTDRPPLFRTEEAVGTERTFERLEQQMQSLSDRLAQLERREDLGHPLNQLAESIGSLIEQRLAEPHQAAVILSPASFALKGDSSDPHPTLQKTATADNAPEIDPLLSRLAPLFEDF